MAKQLNINLAFTADTGQAQAKIQELQSSLMSISSGVNLTGSKESISQAINAAKELQIHLNNAFNVNTGKLDLSKLNQSLSTTKGNITQLSTSLLSAGDSGKQAFVQLAQSVAAADRPVVALNGKLAELGTVLKNTVKWQISSSLIHGFMGAVSGAYNYAKDLNRSLNDIRIVTGLNTDKMSQFAISANKAAKNLSTTTNEYAKASLIYFQQGLNEQEVKDRTDVTIKMANVSRQSAQEVSDQLTAIWNNFYDGSQSLESFADKMVALGAATASSSDEIAGGLEKFAAIGETIGLSFDYAAGALATITANTRESEEVVGTALKTIFARIQGLKMGETLEDGVELNKYSEALAKIGVDVLDAQNNLISANDILDKTAAKWKGLTDAEQTALAQTVAGIRQYNQFIALMDNWDDGTSDSMVANLKTIESSGGALQQQADLYEESWEAASNRVRASLEAIYTDVIDDDFFIDITNGFSKMLDGVHEFIQGAGGIKTLFIGLGSIFLSSFAHKIQPALAELRHNFTVVFQGAQKQAQDLSHSMNQVFQAKMNDTNLKFSDGQRQELSNAIQLNEAKSRLNVLSKTLTAQEQQRYSTELAIIQSQQDEAAVIARRIDNTREEIALLEQAYDYEKASAAMGKEREQTENQLIRIKATAAANLQSDGTVENQQRYEQAKQALDQYRASTENAKFAIENYGQALYEAYAAEMKATDGKIQGRQVTLETSEIFSVYIDRINQLNSAVQNSNGAFGTQIAQLKAMESEIMMAAGAIPGFKEAFESALNSKSPEELSNRLSALKDILSGTTIPAEQLAKILRALGQGTNVDTLNKSYKSLGKDLEMLINKQKELNGLMNQFKPAHVVTGIEKITQTAAGLGQVAMAIQSVRSIVNAWNNDDMTFGEKLTTTFMGISMIVPAVIGSLKSLNTITGASVLMEQMQNAELMKGLVTRIVSKETIDAETLAKQTGMSVDQAELAIATAKLVAIHGNMTATSQETATKLASIVAKKLSLTAEQQETLTKHLLNGLTLKQALAEMGLTGAKAKGITATIAATLANWGMNASLAALIASTLVFAAAIAGLFLVGYGIVKMFQAWKANTPEEKMRAAREEAANLGEQLNEVKKEAEDLKSAFNEYDQVAEKLASCTKGTQEWTDALKENNDKVLDLMKKYPKLASLTKEGEQGLEQAISIDGDGKLIIADWAIKELTFMANEKIGSARIASNLANQNARELEIDYLQEKRDRIADNQLRAEWREATKAEIAGYKRGNKHNMKEITDSQNKKSYYTKDSSTAQTVEDFAKKLINKFGLEEAKNHIETELSNLTLHEQEQVRQLIDSESELRAAIEANTNALQIENAAAANEMLTGYDPYDTSEYKGHISQIVGDNMQEHSWETSNQYMKDLQNDDKRMGLWQDYVEYMGMTAENGYHNLTFESADAEGNISYSYIDSKGNPQEDKVATVGMMGNSLAARDIAKENKQYGMEMTDQFAKFTSKDQADIFTAAATGDESYLSPELLEKSDEELKKIIETMDLSKETLEKLGYSTKDYGGDTKEALEKARKAFEEQEQRIISSRRAYDKLSTTYSGYLVRIEQGTEIVGDQVKYSEDAEKAAGELANSLKDALGGIGSNWDEMLGPEFIANNQALIEDFMNGVSGKADELRQAIGKEIWVKMGLDSTDFDTHWNAINQAITEAYGMGLLDLEIGATLDNSQVLAALEEMVNSTAMSAEQAHAYILDAFGIDVDFEEDEAETRSVTTTVDSDPEITPEEFEGNNPTTGEPQTYRYPKVVYKNTPSEPAEGTSKVGLPKLKVKSSGEGGKLPRKVSGGNITKTKAPGTTGGTGGGGGNGGGGGGGSKPGGGGGGGGSQTKPAKKSRLTKKSETVERYKELNDQLKKIEDTISDTSLEMDKLWGAARINAMSRYRKALQQQISTHEEYKQEILENLNADKQALIDFMQEMPDGEIGGLGDLGLQFEFDPNTGAIINYTSIMSQLHEKLNELEIQKNNMATEEQQSEFDESTLSPFKERIDWVKELISQYDETNELFREKENEIEEAKNDIRTSFLEEVEYKVELRLQLNENDLDLLEYEISKIEDKFYYMARAIDLDQLRFDNIATKLKLAYQPFNDILWEYNYGISHLEYSDVAEAATEAIPNIIEALEELKELDTGMLEAYGNSLELAQEQFEKYTQFLEASMDKMGHYRSMLSLIGKEMDYDKMGVFLQAEFDIAKNSVQANKAYYEELQSEYEALYNRWIDEGDKLKGYEKEMLEQKLYDAKVAVTEAEEEYLSSLEMTGEKAQEILQNSLSKIQKQLEESLVGSSLEDYMTELDRLSKKQEEYLTTTNKMYETNKLIRQAQMDMDKTDNKRAKQQYNDYVKYIEQLQESGELSSYELSIAQAKYEVLQAQIALEEAQEAKSQVRLTRDAEGNYGYVYTASEDKVNEAEQALADAENKLYNIGLQGAQDYQTKYAETMQEAVETFAAINEQYQTGQIATEEEYNAKMAEARQYYYDLLKQYNELYYIGHDLLVEESFENEADYLLQGIGNIEDFADYTDEYLEQANDAFDIYNDNVSDITTIVDKNLDTLQKGTNEVTKESEKLADEIETDLIPQMDKQLLSIREITSEYAHQYDKVKDLREEYENLAKTLQNVSEYGILGKVDTSKIEDFSAEIQRLLDMGYKEDNKYIQELLRLRWEKMGGVDNYNYTELIEQAQAKNDESRVRMLQVLRNYKILNTDWEAMKEANPEDAEWIDAVIAEKNNMINPQVVENISTNTEEMEETLEKIEYDLSDIPALAEALLHGEFGIKERAQYFMIDAGMKDEKLREEVIKYAWEILLGHDSQGDYTWGLLNMEIEEYLLENDPEKYWKFFNANKEMLENKTPNEQQYVTQTVYGKDGRVEDSFTEYYYNNQYIGRMENLFLVGKTEDEVKNINFSAYQSVDKFDPSIAPTLPRDIESSLGGAITIYTNMGTVTLAGESIDEFVEDHPEHKEKVDQALKNTTKMDTGGYTGDWGPEGKLAVLHEKELVLNKQDTENFLTATNILREVNQMLNNNAFVASLGMTNLSAMTIGTPADQILQQEVTIHADFPNVTDHNEIELAIDNLINAASQHAYRT